MCIDEKESGAVEIKLYQIVFACDYNAISSEDLSQCYEIRCRLPRNAKIETETIQISQL